MNLVIESLFVKSIADIILSFAKTRKLIIRHIDMKVGDRQELAIFFVGLVSSEDKDPKLINCSANNGNNTVRISEEFVDCCENKPFTEAVLLIFEIQVCPFCFRFHRFCICFPDKKPIWYLRICALPNKSVLYMDIACVKASLFPHILHFPFPKYLIRGLVCDSASCTELLETKILQHVDPAVVYCKNKVHHLNMLF